MEVIGVMDLHTEVEEHRPGFLKENPELESVVYRCEFKDF